MSKYDGKDTVYSLSDSDSLLDIMLQVEDYLDSLDIYAFKNWIDGELVEGPYVKRYWVQFTLKYPYKKMPDPQGGLRLLKYGSKVQFKKTTEEVAQDPTDRSNMDEENKPKMKEEKIWLVFVKIPRRFVEDMGTEDLQTYNDEIEVDDVEDAQDEGVDETTGVTGEESETEETTGGGDEGDIGEDFDLNL